MGPISNNLGLVMEGMKENFLVVTSGSLSSSVVYGSMWFWI